MKYVVADYFLDAIPQTVLENGLLARGIAGHWTAGGKGEAGARATARYFTGVEGHARNASYHEIWWWDSATRTFGVLRIVPANRAAHSMNPNQPPNGPWNPNARVRRILGDMWWNPNSYSYAVSFAGMPADLKAAMTDPYFVECAARRIKEIMAQEASHGNLNADPMFNHGEGQPSTRSDWGADLRPAILAILNADTEDPQVILELQARIAELEDIAARRWRRIKILAARRDALMVEVATLEEEIAGLEEAVAELPALRHRLRTLRSTLATVKQMAADLDALVNEPEA